MGQYSTIFPDNIGGKKLRVTITLTENNRPYKKLRYFTVQIKGSEKKFNQAYRQYRKMFDNHKLLRK